MKAIAWAALALMAACLGCSQGGGKKSADARLTKLESDFGRFEQEQHQEQARQQARDADIDQKLGRIATRLDSLTPQPKPVKAAPQTKAAKVQPAASGRSLVAGQVIPLSSIEPQGQAQPAPLSGQPAAPAQGAPAGQYQPAPLSGQPAAAQAPAQPATQPSQPAGKLRAGQVQPLGASAQAQTAQAQPQGASAQAPATQAQPAGDPLGLAPPVVTLPPQQQAPVAATPLPPAPQPAPRETRRAEPYDQASRPAKAKRGQAAQAQTAPAAETAPAPAAQPAQAATATAGGNDPVEAAQLYTEAMRSITANKNDDGRRKLNELLTRYPNSEKAPLALYWVGESYLNERSYNQAILAYKDVTTRYPKSFKAPEAVFKTAEAYERLGDKSNAVFHLKLLVDEYPGSELANKARQKLKQLGQ